jgi:hypothetical protein
LEQIEGSGVHRHGLQHVRRATFDRSRQLIDRYLAVNVPVRNCHRLGIDKSWSLNWCAAAGWDARTSAAIARARALTTSSTSLHFFVVKASRFLSLLRTAKPTSKPGGVPTVTR